MPLQLDPFAAPISKSRPLAGVTMLLVEDSRFCSEAVRLMSLRAGARLRRADCVRSAHKHLAVYRPDVMLVDLGLPDGHGLDLIAEMHANRMEGQVILAISADDEPDTMARVKTAGGDGFLAKPLLNLKHFQTVIEALLRDEAPSPLVLVDTSETKPELNQQALFDDLDRITDILQQALPAGDRGQMRYCAQFVSSLAQTAHDPELMRGARRFFHRIESHGGGERSGGEMLSILQARLASGQGKIQGNAHECVA